MTTEIGSSTDSYTTSSKRQRLPRFHDRDPENSPMVTILGAGIAGLTAAHELAERGFVVQVVENRESTEYYGEVEIGGLARSQWARVKAPLDALHPELIAELGEERTKTELVRVEAEALLHLFAYSRRRWVQTLPPLAADFAVTEFNGPDPSIIASGTLSARVNAVDDTKRVLDKARAALREAVLIRRAHFLYNLTAERFLVVERTRTEIDGAQGKPACDERALAVERLKRTLCAAGDHDGAAKLDAALAGVFTKPSETRGGSDPAPKGYLDGAKLGEYFELEFLEDPDFELKVLGAVVAANAPDTERFKDILNDTDKLRDALAHLRREVICLEMRADLRPPGAEPSPHAVAAQKFLLDGTNSFFDGYFAKVADTEGSFDSARAGKGRARLYVIEQIVPGEHGFRFFPRHYKNLFALMQRIPLLDPGGFETLSSVYDNLLVTTKQALGMPSKNPDSGFGVQVDLQRTLPKSLADIVHSLRSFLAGTGAQPGDVARFQLKMLRYLTTGRLRRWKEYERVSWRDFLGLDGPSPEGTDEAWNPPGWGFSPEMGVQLRAAAQALLAYSVSEADAHSYGNFSMQTVVDELDPDRRVDLILNGPSSKAWLRPWKLWLARQGVRFYHGEVAELATDQHGELKPVFRNGEIFAERNSDHPKFNDSPDFFVLALPLRQSADLVAGLGSLDEADMSDFKQLLEFRASVEERGALRSMSGLQLHFQRAVRWGDAHTYYPESLWGISAITQTNYWKIRPTRQFGYLGLVSIDLADFSWYPDQPSRPVAFGRTPVSLVAGAHRQILHGSPRGIAFETEGDPKKTALPEPDYFHLDEGLVLELGQNNLRLPTNRVIGISTPYLANLVGQFRLRPGLVDRLPDNDLDTAPKADPAGDCACDISYRIARKRWVLAGAHMASFTRMMTMEGSCESGMHAVNAILRTMNRVAGDTGPLQDVRAPELLYNGVREGQPIQLTEPHDIEDDEVPDLKVLKDLDDKLCSAGLHHILSIMQAERALVAMERQAQTGSEIQGLVANFREIRKFLGSASEEEILGRAIDLICAVFTAPGDKTAASVLDRKEVKADVDWLRSLLTPSPAVQPALEAAVRAFSEQLAPKKPTASEGK